MTEPEAEAPVPSKRRVLVVEDDAVVLGLLTKIIGEAGYDVVGAPTGEAALAELDKQLFDAVLLDLNLPGSIDGLEVCRRLRAEAATAAVPVVIISAMDDEDTKKRATEAGATAYFSKPLSSLK